MAMSPETAAIWPFSFFYFTFFFLNHAYDMHLAGLLEDWHPGDIATLCRQPETFCGAFRCASTPKDTLVLWETSM